MRSRRSLAVLTAAPICAALLVTTLTASNAARVPPPAPRLERAAVGLALKRVGNFQTPIYVTGAPGSPKLLYVVEQGGRIKVVDKGRKSTFLDIHKLVRSTYEEGLFSVAFHPGFATNGLLYVFYTNRKGNQQLDEFKASSPLTADPASRRGLVHIPHPKYDTHNADHLAFQGGLLYVAMGDGGGPGDPGDDAKTRRNFLGKILRIDPLDPPGKAAYSVPATNPFVGRPGRDEIFAFGLRNPWRFSFDTPPGGETRITIGDVGQDTYEEINYLKLADASGAFFGWDEWEAFTPFECDGRCVKGSVRPIFTYRHGPGCSIVPGYVIRDPALPGWQGRYLYTDFCNGRVRSLVPKLHRVGPSRPTNLKLSLPVSFGVDLRQRQYVISNNGPVFRIVPRPRPGSEG